MWLWLIPIGVGLYYAFKPEERPPQVPPGLVPAKPGTIPTSFISRIRISRIANFDSTVNAKIGDIIDTDDPFPVIQVVGSKPGQVLIDSPNKYTVTQPGIVTASYVGNDNRQHKVTIIVT